MEPDPSPMTPPTDDSDEMANDHGFAPRAAVHGMSGGAMKAMFAKSASSISGGKKAPRGPRANAHILGPKVGGAPKSKFDGQKVRPKASPKITDSTKMGNPHAPKASGVHVSKAPHAEKHEPHKEGEKPSTGSLHLGSKLKEAGKLAVKAVTATSMAEPAAAKIIPKEHHMGFTEEGKTHHFGVGK